MFALTANRFYCYYPNLFARKEFINIRERVQYIDPSSVIPFYKFNVGVTNVDGHHSACDDGCPIVWRRSGLIGVGVLRWGGLDGGEVVESDRDDPMFNDRAHMWKGGKKECTNNLCPNYKVSSDLHVRYIQKTPRSSYVARTSWFGRR